MTTTAQVADFASSISEFIKELEAGNEVLLVQGELPVARVVPAAKKENSGTPQIRSFEGRRVLAPDVSQRTLAEELFIDE